MTYAETAAAMRRMADIFEQKGGHVPMNNRVQHVSADHEAGMAGMLCFLRDLLTIGAKEEYSRVDLLVMLEAISRDIEIFPCGCGRLMWDMEVEEIEA